MSNYSSLATPTPTIVLLRRITHLFVFIGVLFGLVGTTTAWAVDIDRANWSNKRDRLTVRGDSAPDNVTVTIRYGQKEDNGAVIGTTQTDNDGDWTFRINGPDPVPCDVTAQAGGDDADKRVRRAPNNCSNDGGTPAVCNIAVSPTTLAFGDVTVGSSATLSTTVSNSGDAACNITLEKNGSIDFAIASNTSVNVSPGGSQNISVSYTPGEVGADTGNVTVNSNDPDTATVSVGLTGNGVDNVTICNPATDSLSINSTSQSGCPDAVIQEQTIVSNDTPAPDGNTYSVLAINDLGMHCGDLDTRISSILPPFQVLLGQVIQKGASPTLNPAGVSLEYSAASNLSDPASDPVTQSFPGLLSNGSTYKTNFWNTVINTGVYNAFYPFDIDGMMEEDLGLPVPNVETLYINGAGNVVPVPGGTGIIEAVQHAMPGIVNPYGGDNLGNDPQAVKEHYDDKPFFVSFPFGYVAENVNWYEGAGIPFAAYDDYGRENAYPLVRVEAKLGTKTVSTVDTVLPISGEASCTNCHTTLDDYVSVHGDHTNHRSSEPTLTLANASLPVAISVDDEEDMPPMVSLEYAADINVLRLHDFRHGNKYVNTSCDSAGVNCLADPDIHDPCTINQANPNGSSSCLTHKALEQGKPVVCQVCHYTPALDLAQVGPMAGAPGTGANGRNQVAHSSNSNVMHGHHGTLEESPGNLLFKTMPAPNQLADGTITNQGERLNVLEETCYQCHPGTNVQCLRGAMFNGGMLCNDCHGDMQQVGADFSAGVSPATPGAFVLDQGNYYDPGSSQPRVPWANEPGCGSCHTGTATNNLAGSAGTLVNTRDIDNNVDGIRLRQAYRSGDAKATPIVPTNKRFAEPAVPASFNGFDNPGAGNPQLYRVSTGHGGVMCEGCHGATHAEWPNGNPNANDNVAADQLQGHVGAIIECDTCHTNANNLSPDATPNSLKGPHGMHAVGANTSFATGRHKEKLEEGQNKNACRDCHGQEGQGTVLSRMAKDRVLECKEDTTFCPNGNTALFPKGHAVGCVECHDNGLYED